MPIINYFGERQEEAEKRNQEYLTGLSEKNRQRMLQAEKEGKAVYAQHRKKNEIHDDGILSILNLYRSRYGTGAIASMLDLPENVVYRSLQIPLLRYIAGARDMECLRANKKLRVWPRCAVIRKELTNLGIEVDAWKESMMQRHAMSACTVKNLVYKDRPVSIADALAVVDYFGGNADEYFAPTKEKAAE